MGLLKKVSNFKVKPGDTIVQTLQTISSISYKSDGTPKNVPILTKTYTANLDGVYRISFTSSSSSNTSSQEYKLAYIINGDEKFYYIRYIPFSPSATLTADIPLKKGDVLQLYWSNMGVGGSTLKEIKAELKIDMSSIIFNQA